MGASGRTLARLFVAGTGVTFGQWRTAVRMSAALERLASGSSVAATAGAVGYATPSAFVAAFGRQLGCTPAAYFSPPPPRRGARGRRRPAGTSAGSAS